MRKNGRRRGFGIPRVSKKGGREGESFRSPDNQWEDIARTARAKGIELIARDDDIDVSGTTMQRRALRVGIEAIANGEADCLVFAKLDRYARTTLGGLQTLDEVEALGGSLYFGDLDVDTSSPTGRQIFTILLSNAEREVAEKAIELARNAKAATLAGIAISPLLPGYRRVNDPGGKRDRRVELDPERSRLIRPLFERRAAGHSWTAIREWWHGRTGEWVKLPRFRKMVESRLYLGELHFGGVESPVRHKALVTPRLWQDAQTVTASRPKRSDSSPALLAGVVVCSGCKRPMTPSRGGSQDSPIYRCQSRAKSGWECPAPVAVMVSRVDEYVVEQFRAWARDHIRDAVTTGDLDEDFASVDAKVADAEEELAAYLDAIPARSARFAGGMRKREAAVESALAERRALESERVVGGVRYIVTERWDELNDDEKRQMLRAGIERVLVHPGSVTSRGGYARRPVGERCDLVFASD